VSSRRRAPHFEQMRITGDFCAAELPVEQVHHSTSRRGAHPPLSLIGHTLDTRRAPTEMGVPLKLTPDCECGECMLGSVFFLAFPMKC
jgi:hypothetical protein